MSNLTYGSGGQAGYQGSSSGSAGGFQITDWKEDIQKKYNNRFIIKTDYDSMSFTPTNIIIDTTKTNKEYKFIPNSMSNIVNETDLFIQTLITTIRDEKITNIING
jgi:hypothetical protein